MYTYRSVYSSTLHLVNQYSIHFRVISVEGAADHEECANYLLHELLSLSKDNVLITPEFFVTLERCFEILRTSTGASLVEQQDFSLLFSEVVRWVSGQKWDSVKRAVSHRISTNAQYLLLIPPVECVYAFGIVALATNSPIFFRALSSHAVYSLLSVIFFILH